MRLLKRGRNLPSEATSSPARTSSAVSAFLVLGLLCLFQFWSASDVSKAATTTILEGTVAQPLPIPLKTITPETVMARLPSDPNDQKTTAVICAIGRDELPYIDEWTDYHLALGFAHLYIYDNSNIFDLQQWKDERYNVTVIHWPGEKQQLPAMNHCFKRAFEDGHTWMLAIDFDEFLKLEKHDHVVDFCKEYIQKDSMAIHWRTFGTSGRFSYEPIPVTKRFQYRPLDDYRLNRFIKTFTRLENFDFSNPLKEPHLPPPKPGFVIRNTDGDEVKLLEFWKGGSGPSDMASLYHYRTKSRGEYFYAKTVRGDVFFDKEAYANMGVTGTDTDGKPIPIGIVFDDSLWKRLVELVPKYGVFDRFYNKGAPAFDSDKYQPVRSTT